MCFSISNKPGCAGVWYMAPHSGAEKNIKKIDIPPTCIIRITYYSVHLLQDKKYRACAAERRELRRTSARRQAPSQGQPPTNLDYFFPEIQQPTIHNKIPSTIASEEQEKTSRPDRLKLLIRRVCHIFNIQQSSWNKLKNIDCCIMY